MSANEFDSMMKRMDKGDTPTLIEINKWGNRLKASLYIDRNEAGTSEL